MNSCLGRESLTPMDSRVISFSQTNRAQLGFLIDCVLISVLLASIFIHIKVISFSAASTAGVDPLYLLVCQAGISHSSEL